MKMWSGPSSVCVYLSTFNGHQLAFGGGNLWLQDLLCAVTVVCTVPRETQCFLKGGLCICRFDRNKCLLARCLFIVVLSQTTCEIPCATDRSNFILIRIYLSVPLGKSWPKLLSWSLWIESVYHRKRSARSFLQVWPDCWCFHCVWSAVSAFKRICICVLWKCRGC